MIVAESSGEKTGREKPVALALLGSERPRNVGWLQAAGLLFGDWGTSRLYVLGLALLFAGRTSFWLILLMSLLIVAVGWAYTQICRIYPDGGGVYTAAKSRNRTLAVVGALLLFADYTVTASLSSLDAFHYFGLGAHHEVVAKGQLDAGPDAGGHIDTHPKQEESVADALTSFKSPAVWAIISIAVIGAFNLMGPKHTGGFALAAALGMVFITLLISAFALPQLNWKELPHRIGSFEHSPADMWIAFVSIVLALSGVEAIANLTGVMKKPVAKTARKAIWVVTLEVAIFNVILALCMLALPVINREKHVADMAAFLSGHYVGAWGEMAVRIIGGVLLLSATNTALTDMISVQYLMARDGELPAFMQKLNRFGVPWVPALVAGSVPIVVLLISHNLESLAALYAIGVIGAVAINVTLCSLHPRLRRMRRKVPMLILGFLLLGIWVTLAYTKHHALVFVTVVLAIGLILRKLTQLHAARRPKPSLLRQAILEQLPEDAWIRPKQLIGTYGSEALAKSAMEDAKRRDAVLVVCFIRQVNLSYKFESEQKLTIDTDLAALKTFAKFLEVGHQLGVPILPVYDTGPDAAELLAENAAVYGCDRVLIGTSRQGALYHLIKGHFQRKLESILPNEIPVQVLNPQRVALMEDLRRIFKNFDASDLRWSYIVIAGMIPIGIVISIFFAHGWSVWPFVGVIGFLVILNELVDRSGEGFPPLQVYGFFICVLLIYAIALAIISALNVFVLFAGMMVIFYFSGKAYVEKREREKLIATRQENGQCIYCGENLATEEAYCQECGNEPAAAARVRISAVMKNNASGARMRQALTKKSGSAQARAKEQALVAKSYHRQRSSRRGK